MKKWMGLWLAILLLLPACGLGEIVGFAENGDYIHRYVAKNGQELFFTAMREDPTPFEEDVNFDGSPDLVFVISRGVGNTYFEFFLWQDGKYEMAIRYGEETGLSNYVLYPEEGLVSTFVSNGGVGALFEKKIYRWEGTYMRPLRSAVSEEYSVFAYDDESYWVETYPNIVCLTIDDYAADEFEGERLVEAVYTLETANDPSWFAAVDDTLWNGLR